MLPSLLRAVRAVVSDDSSLQKAALTHRLVHRVVQICLCGADLVVAVSTDSASSSNAARPSSSAPVSVPWLQRDTVLEAVRCAATLIGGERTAQQISMPAIPLAISMCECSDAAAVEAALLLLAALCRGSFKRAQDVIIESLQAVLVPVCCRRLGIACSL